MYLDYITGAIVLIPIYFFIIRGLNLKFTTAIFIYFYRAIFSIALILYANNNPADAKMYLRGNEENIGLVGSGFVLNIIDLSTNYLNIKGYALYSLFGLLGAIGCCYLYCAIKKCDIRGVNKINNISVLFCFLPSLTFWTLAPGKDVICFLAITYALYSYIHLKDNNFKLNLKIIFSTLILLIVRPHVGASLIIGYILFYIFQIKKKKNLYLRLIILSTITLVFFSMIPFLQTFGSIDIFNPADSIILLEERFSQTAIDRANMNYVSRVIFFLFSPLPTIKFSILYLAEYINTIFIMYFLFTLLKDKKSYRNISSNPFFLYSIILLLILSLIIYNPGLAARQKWMFLIPLIVSLKNNRFLNYKKTSPSIFSD